MQISHSSHLSQFHSQGLKRQIIISVKTKGIENNLKEIASVYVVDNCLIC